MERMRAEPKGWYDESTPLPTKGTAGEEAGDCLEVARNGAVRLNGVIAEGKDVNDD